MITGVGKGWAGWANYCLMFCCPGDPVQMPWLFTWQEQICHWKDRKSLQEAHEHPVDLGDPPANLAFLLDEGDSLCGLCQDSPDTDFHKLGNLLALGYREKSDLLPGGLEWTANAHSPLTTQTSFTIWPLANRILPGGILLGDDYSGDKIDPTCVYKRHLLFLGCLLLLLKMYMEGLVLSKTRL